MGRCTCAFMFPWLGLMLLLKNTSAVCRWDLSLGPCDSIPLAPDVLLPPLMPSTHKLNTFPTMSLQLSVSELRSLWGLCVLRLGIYLAFNTGPNLSSAPSLSPRPAFLGLAGAPVGRLKHPQWAGLWAFAHAVPLFLLPSWSCSYFKTHILREFCSCLCWCSGPFFLELISSWHWRFAGGRVLQRVVPIPIFCPAKRGF